MDNKACTVQMQSETMAGPHPSVMVAPPTAMTVPSYTMTTINNAQPQVVQMGEPPTPPTCGSLIANAIAFLLCPVTSCLSLPGIILGILSYVENRSNNMRKSSDYKGHSFRLAISAWVIGIAIWIIIIVVVVETTKAAVHSLSSLSRYW